MTTIGYLLYKLQQLRFILIDEFQTLINICLTNIRPTKFFSSRSVYSAVRNIFLLFLFFRLYDYLITTRALVLNRSFSFFIEFFSPIFWIIPLLFIAHTVKNSQAGHWKRKFNKWRSERLYEMEKQRILTPLNESLPDNISSGQARNADKDNRHQDVGEFVEQNSTDVQALPKQPDDVIR